VVAGNQDNSITRFSKLKEVEVVYSKASCKAGVQHRFFMAMG